MFQTMTRSLLATVIAATATLIIVAGSASPAHAANRQMSAGCANAAQLAPKPTPVPVQHASRAAFILTLR